MYAISFDLNQEMLSKTYGTPSYVNAYNDIKNSLEKFGFNRQQGSVYFGDLEKVNAVTCVTAVQSITKQYSWFAPSVTDIRMLRIEDNNDLKPAIDIMLK